MPSVANALAYSAGIDQQLELPPNLKIGSTAEYRRRFPHSAFTSRRETAEEHAVRSSGQAPLLREEARDIASEVGDVDQSLLAEALLLGSVLAPPARREVRAFEELGISPPLLAEELAGLLRERYTQ